MIVSALLTDELFETDLSYAFKNNLWWQGQKVYNSELGKRYVA